METNTSTTTAEPNPRAVAGSNLPPVPDLFRDLVEAIPAYLDTENAAFTDRAQKLIEAFGRLPETIATEEAASNYTQLVGFLTKLIQAAEDKRGEVTDPALTAQRTIMAWYVEHIFSKVGAAKSDKAGSFGGLKQKCLDRLTAWQREQARLEQVRRAEEARKAQEAAESARKAAEEAERQRRDAEAKERAAEAERLAKIKSEQDLQAAIDEEARQKTAQAKREQDARAAELEARARQEAADIAAQDAAAKNSQLTASTGAFGARSALRDNWQFVQKDFDLLDLNEVKPYFSADHIQQAYNAAAKKIKDTRTLKGGTIVNNSKTSVRS